MESHNSHILQKVLDFKHSLDKILSNPDYQHEAESVRDILRLVAEVEMTADLISKSGMGNTIAGTREKFLSDSSIAEQARSILLSWKAIMKSKSSKKNDSSSTTTATTSAAAATKTTTSTAVASHTHLPAAKFTIPDSSSTTRPSDDAVAAVVAVVDSRRVALSGERRSVFTVFSRLFQKSFPSPVDADRLALDIEEAIHLKFPSSQDSKAYSAKAKTLAFNIQKNQHLKNLLVNGSIPAANLVLLSPSELASHELKEQRERLTTAVLESRRLDWLDTHKASIQADIGVDPNNSWQFDNNDDAQSEPDFEPPDA
eukprot:gene7817-8629_t